MINKYRGFIERGHHFFYSHKFRDLFERVMLYFGLIGFILHLLIIYLNHLNVISLHSRPHDLFNDPISAIYTPFSFILIYEVYLLIYYLPRSFSTSIGKQYEIISLIVIRKIFKDISKLELEGEWFSHHPNVLFSVDITSFLLLFVMVYFFSYLNKVRPKIEEKPPSIEEFILLKKLISVLLVPILVGLAIFSFFDWLIELRNLNLGLVEKISDVNDVFYHDFFAILILIDVFILILSFRYTDRYGQLIRNSGFIISTVLIRLSFSAEGLINIFLILFAVLFGVLISLVYNRIERLEAQIPSPSDSS